MDRPLILAYYLPQFHPFPENDEWWGKGFTEWTNVGKAKPLFKGHYQPRIPSDLGYYDLRVPEVREQQAELAREAGVDGFCYWHYWFGNGHQLMNNIIDEVAETGKPDFPFCLGWANEPWKSKLWNKDSSGDKLLMDQVYGGEEEYRSHYEYARKLFKNKNYVRIEGKPFFLIFQPTKFPDVSQFIELWNKWIKEDGIADGVYFVAHLFHQEDWKYCLEAGFSSVTLQFSQRALKEVPEKKENLPTMVSMDMVNKNILCEPYDRQEFAIPFIMPQWDHSPRSGVKGSVVVDSTPDKFQVQAEKVLSFVRSKENKIVIVKSWNEWGEGNYMEPDLRYGKGFIKALKNAVDNQSVAKLDVIPTKQEAIDKLNLPKDKKVVLCLSTFDNYDKCQKLQNIVDELHRDDVIFLAPNFMSVPEHLSVSSGKQYLRALKYKKKYHIFAINHANEGIPDILNPYYYAASDIVLDIDNNTDSSNVLLTACLYGKPVVMKADNLQMTKLGNISYNSDNPSEIATAIRSTLEEDIEMQGSKNCKFITDNNSSSKIAALRYGYYSSSIL